jgi:hypothetical protein
MPSWIKEYKHVLITGLTLSLTVIGVLIGSIYLEKAQALEKMRDKQQESCDRITRLESQYSYIIITLNEIKMEVKKK